VRGATGSKKVGKFKKKRIRNKRSVVCDVEIFPLRAGSLKRSWPEKKERSRVWVRPTEAAKLVKKAGLRRAIKNFVGTQ
jgi:hypothetical protein